MRARVLHRRTPFGEVLGWRWPTTCAATRITTAQSPTHCAARQCNLRPRHLLVRPFSSLPASRAQCLFTDSPSRAALHLRGAYAVRTDPIPSIQSIRVPDQDVDAWRNAETPLYGWPWSSDNQNSWSHDWPGTETMVRRLCLSLLLHLIVLTSRVTLNPAAFTTSPQRVRELQLPFVFPSFSAGTTLQSPS